MGNKKQKDLLRDLKVRPTKERGQNFLTRPEVVREIVAFANVPAEASVVEIGPGTGSLTEILSEHEKLTLIELEPTFCEFLRESYPHAKIINHDVRTFDFSTLGKDLFVFGNIPYVFSTEIIFQLIRNRRSIRQAVLMTQREFAERVASPPGNRDYGSLSVAVQVYAQVELGLIVSGDSFHPPTAVESRIMKLTFLPEPLVDVGDPEHFEMVVRGAFAQRRKKVVNSLLSRGRWTKDQILTSLQAAGVSSDARAEQISIVRFAALARQLAGGGR